MELLENDNSNQDLDIRLFPDRANGSPMRTLAPLRESDGLSDLLRDLHFRTAIFCRSELRAPWGFVVEHREFVSFHLVTAGSAYLDLESSPDQVRLGEGDLVILPHGDSHVMRDDPATAAVPLDCLAMEARRDEVGRLHSGGSGAATSLLCGGFLPEGREPHRLMAALPPYIHLRRGEFEADAWMAGTLHLLPRQAQPTRPGP